MGEIIDLADKGAIELETMFRSWSTKINEAEDRLQVVQSGLSAKRKAVIESQQEIAVIEKRISDMRKDLNELSDAERQARHIVKRLVREKGDIKSAMFRRMRETL